MYVSYFVDFVADLLHMVKSIEKRMAVYTHPHEKFMQGLVSVEYVGCTNKRLPTSKAYRFVVCDAVAKNIHTVQLVEYIGLIILYFA